MIHSHSCRFLVFASFLLVFFFAMTVSLTGQSNDSLSTDLIVSEDTASFSFSGDTSSEKPWWVWSLLLFGVCSVLGVVAVMAGVGGAILYVPIVGTFFPFHLDFIRGSGLFVSLAGTLSAMPKLLTNGLASLRLALPFALVGSITSVLGAKLGLALPEKIIELALGIVIFGIVVVMSIKKKDPSAVLRPDSLSRFLRIKGEFYDPVADVSIQWSVSRSPQALVAFIFIGFIAGMFGLGAGWANVPVLHLLMGAPFKVAVASSLLIIAIEGSAASWVYLNQGAILPIITIPSVAGMIIGSRVGALFLSKKNSSSLRWIVLSILALSGIRSLLSGLGILP